MPSESGPRRSTEEEYRRVLGNWCKQTVLFAMIVRARDLGKPLPDKFASDAREYAEEVYQKALAQVGPIENFDKPQQWMAAVVDETFRWVQDHLER